ncbi:MAG: hypothetical protein ACI9A0_003318 [Pseudoalteromonas tetraodonis]|jgi:hypothetical protein
MKKQSALTDAPQTIRINHIKKLLKREKFLIALLASGYDGLRGLECTNRPGILFNLTNEKVRFWSSCLHSDVSSLEHDLNISIDRKIDPYKSPEGHTSNFKRYWLDSYQDAKLALKRLNTYRVKRRKEPFNDTECEKILSVFL